jgi:hypothetical protein
MAPKNLLGRSLNPASRCDLNHSTVEPCTVGISTLGIVEIMLPDSQPQSWKADVLPL